MIAAGFGVLAVLLLARFGWPKLKAWALREYLDGPSR